MSNGIDIEVKGPVFDGRAQVWTDADVRKMEHHLGSVVADMVRGELERVLRKETPYYRLQVTSTEYPERTVVNDGGVVYGPWLEGTGSRNKTTRFKGYATFRRITALANDRAESIIQPYVDALVEKIDHGA